LQKVQTQFLATFFLFIWQHFWNHFCTIFLMFSSSLRNLRTLSLSKLAFLATTRTPNLWSFWITSYSFSMLSLVTAGAIMFQPFCAFRKLCHSNTCTWGVQLFIYLSKKQLTTKKIFLFLNVVP
jgi:hypothetical protein